MTKGQPPESWTEETPIQAFLAAFDMSGFTQRPKADTLLRHRHAFFQVIALHWL